MNTDKLKELLGAATPGPWSRMDDVNPEFVTAGTDSEGAYIYADSEADAALIVAAVNALPSLIARLEAAEKVVEAARVYFTGYCQDEAAEDGPEFTGCSLDQHFDAARLQAALTTYDQEKARG